MGTAVSRMGALLLAALGCGCTAPIDVTSTSIGHGANSADLAASAPADLGSPATLDGSAPDLTVSSGRGFSPDLGSANGDLLPLCQAISVSTLTGNGSPGFLDGSGSIAQLNNPLGIAVDSAGNVYVADFANNRIRKVAPDGTTSTLAGNGTSGSVDGTGGPSGTTSFALPAGVAVDLSGNVYVADQVNARVRKIAPDGTTSTLAGNGTSGFADGTGGPSGTAQFKEPYGIALDGLGFGYVSDEIGQRIRKIDLSTGDTSTLTGNGTFGFFDGTGGPNGTSVFHDPEGLAVDKSGNVFVADDLNNRIRKVASDGTTSTLAGNGAAGTTDGAGGPTGNTEFSQPAALALDSDGSLYVADESNNRIRRVAPDGTTSTLVGTMGEGFQDGSGCTAQLKGPVGVAIFGKLLYVLDEGNQRVRVVHLP
jgi:trimeric autotransporter adhesin